MGECTVRLPSSNNKTGLSGRLDKLLQNVGGLSQSLVADATEEFFRETKRWRHVNTYVELSAGDQEIRFEPPAGIKTHAIGPIFAQLDQCNEIEIYKRHDGSSGSHKYNRPMTSRTFLQDFFHQDALHTEDLAYYQPEANLVMFSAPLQRDIKFRLTLTMYPRGYDAIDNVPESLLDEYRDAIIGIAILNALKMPGKPWTVPDEDGYINPLQVRMYMDDVKKQKRRAKFFHAGVGQGRPHGDRDAEVLSRGRVNASR